MLLVSWPLMSVAWASGIQAFGAEVRVDVDSLDPENMPDRLSGFFTKLQSASPGDSELANLRLHSDRTGGGSSHIIFFGRLRSDSAKTPIICHMSIASVSERNLTPRARRSSSIVMRSRKLPA